MYTIKEQQVLMDFMLQLVAKYLDSSWKLHIYDNVKGSWVGRCDSSLHIISINGEFFDHAPVELLADILLHEISHALQPIGSPHGKAWKTIFIAMGGSGTNGVECKYDANGLPEFQMRVRKKRELKKVSQPQNVLSG